MLGSVVRRGAGTHVADAGVADSAAKQTLPRIMAGRRWYDFFAGASAGEEASSPTGMTPAQERRLVMAAAAGDPAARERLIEAFLPAISGIARLYRSAPTIDRAELLQEGVIGLLRAAERFDPSLGTPFWAYAGWWVRQAMQQLVAELTRPTVLSDRAQRALAQLREARRGYLQTHGHEPTAGELAALVDLSRDQVESLLAVERVPQPLQMSVDESHGQPGVQDVLADPSAQEEYERIISRLEIDRIRDLTSTLSDREREILYQHYGLEGRPARTLREIGEALGISAERVRQIEAQSLERLRIAALGQQT
ncbi:MAG: polymerase primary sigma factor [Gaiellales bacterium]|nr:polymerase primary sigma factor [Gaiellales bacterium]